MFADHPTAGITPVSLSIPVAAAKPPFRDERPAIFSTCGAEADKKMLAGARNWAKDRRGTQRARLAAPTVTVTVGGLLVDAVGSDVSPGGMRLMSARPVRTGDAVSLVFFLDGDIVCARGKVCWCARTRHDLFAFGIAVTAVEEDGASLLARFCRGSVS